MPNPTPQQPSVAEPMTEERQLEKRLRYGLRDNNGHEIAESIDGLVALIDRLRAENARLVDLLSDANRSYTIMTESRDREHAKLLRAARELGEMKELLPRLRALHDTTCPKYAPWRTNHPNAICDCGAEEQRELIDAALSPAKEGG